MSGRKNVSLRRCSIGVVFIVSLASSNIPPFAFCYRLWYDVAYAIHATREDITTPALLSLLPLFILVNNFTSNRPFLCNALLF